MDSDELIQTVVTGVQALRKYHRHEVVGLDRLPSDGRVLIAVNHSLATYDIAMLSVAIYKALDRMPRPLIDRLFFKVPYLGNLATALGALQGSPENAQSLLEADEIVTVAPGGMREALRPSSERYQIRWDRRFGFVRLAMKTRSPIVLAACPKADDLFDVYPSNVTAWVYKTFKVPVFLARGLGPTPLPRPIKLVHFLSEPLMPPPWSDDEEAREARVKAFHAKLVTRMHDLIGEAIQYRS